MTEFSLALSEKPSAVVDKMRAFPPGVRARELARNPSRVLDVSGIFAQARQEANR